MPAFSRQIHCAPQPEQTLQPCSLHATECTGSGAVRTRKKTEPDPRAEPGAGGGAGGVVAIVGSYLGIASEAAQISNSNCFTTVKNSRHTLRIHTGLYVAWRTVPQQGVSSEGWEQWWTMRDMQGCIWAEHSCLHWQFNGSLLVIISHLFQHSPSLGQRSQCRDWKHTLKGSRTN